MMNAEQAAERIRRAIDGKPTFAAQVRGDLDFLLAELARVTEARDRYGYELDQAGRSLDKRRVERDRLEASLRERDERIEHELEAIQRWAAEQNAGNAFADQVRQWAMAKRAALAGEDACQG